ncbi:hypothetical protein [Nocardia asteroides]|uniref:hypothetical protein n=1 Tax=Nocardia asteroides TaxID=1824 RepID=UPI001E3752C2|nr:hypothetical protein [Nocardia asteroides]UGT61814.1 hypothetical protein LTT61_00190 [Nocardia asteroides]
MTEDEISYRWSPWRGQQPPPHGPQVQEQVPAEVRLAMADALLSDYQDLIARQRSDLAGVLKIPVGQYSFVELIEAVRQILARQRDRITELEAMLGPEPEGRG